MRRKDREILVPEKIEEIINSCICCRLGFYDEGEVYILPLNFGYVLENQQYTFYFHGAKEGRKIELIKQKPQVGFEMDCNVEVYGSEGACTYSARFQSIIGSGTVAMVEDSQERIKGMRAIMLKNTGKADWEFPEAMLKQTAIFKLEIDRLSCKEHE